jgi:hypothetical protein
MAKNNNLTDFLTDVADAIRAKKGTTAKINPQDFSSEIASISTGGGGGGGTSVAVSKSDVNFYDYDGTLLFSYTKGEFLDIDELPALPTHDGLICQGWNWSYGDAIAYVGEYGMLNIGAAYIIDDGRTRLYIRIAAEGRMDVPLYIYQSVSDGVVIDWGDNSPTETLNGAGNVSGIHTYAQTGDYVISLRVASGTLGLGRKSNSYCVLGSTSTKVYVNMLQKVEIGSGVTAIYDYAFYSCYSLASVVIPNSVNSIEVSAFNKCSNVAFYDFTSHTSVPTLSNANAFTEIASDCEIRVPAALADEWKAAANWSTYADKIVGY